MTSWPKPRLLRDARGVAAVEFALVAPIMLIGLLGVLDLGYTMYTASLLEGTIHKTARDSTIQGAGGRAATLDARVEKQVRNIAPGAEITFSRTAYTSFVDARQPEDFTDTNGDGICNDNEPFEDANGNGVWDADRGQAGFGGARDAVLYEVEVRFPRLFPVHKLIGQSGHTTMTSRTILRNQPFDAQTSRSQIGNCP